MFFFFFYFDGKIIYVGFVWCNEVKPCFLHITDDKILKFECKFCKCCNEFDLINVVLNDSEGFISVHLCFRKGVLIPGVQEVNIST